MIALLFSYALFASTYTITKAGLQYAQPVFFSGMRMVLGGILLLGYQYFFNRKHFFLDKKYGSLYVQIIFMQIFLGYTLQSWALQYMNSSSSVLIFCLSPFFTAFFSYFYFKETITPKKTLGFFIGLCGLIPIFLNNVVDGFSDVLGFITLPELATLLSVIMFSYSWVLTRLLIKYNNCSLVMLNGVAMFFGGILMLLTSPILDVWDPSPVSHFWPFIQCLITIAIIGNVISFNLYALLMKKYTATLVTFASFVEPLYAAFFGWIFLHEYVSWKFFVSTAVIFVGIYLFYQEELRQGYIEKSP